MIFCRISYGLTGEPIRIVIMPFNLFFKLRDNCFIELRWFLPNINKSSNKCLFVVYIKAKLYIIYATQLPFQNNPWAGFSLFQYIIFLQNTVWAIFDQIICVCRLLCSNSFNFLSNNCDNAQTRIFLIIDTSGNIAKNGKKYSKSVELINIFIFYCKIDSLR